MTTIRRLRAADAETYFEHRRRALHDSPWSFAGSPEDDVARSPEEVAILFERDDESIVLGAYDPELIGSVGLFRMPRPKGRHKAMIWGMFVIPEAQGRGVGQALVERMIEHAKTLPDLESVRLSVTTKAPTAQRLYERCGFRIWGTEPRSLCHAGECVDEHHMILELTQP